MTLAAKYSVKTITVTIGTDVNDQTFATLTGTVVSGAAISLVSMTPTAAKYVVIVVYY